jgi:hypothetical protein
VVRTCGGKCESGGNEKSSVGVGVGVAACYKGKPKVQRFVFELK